MTYSSVRESKDYDLKTCKNSNASVLVRLKDTAHAYLTDDDTNLLLELDDEQDFNTVSATYVFKDPITEKEA